MLELIVFNAKFNRWKVSDTMFVLEYMNRLLQLAVVFVRVRIFQGIPQNSSCPSGIGGKRN
jgi:hypothetical protein